MKREKEFETNGLYHRANEYRKHATDEDEIENIDMTEVFYNELAYMIKNQEIIIININAKMRLGKSSAAMSIGKTIFDLLKKEGIKKKHEQFDTTNIAHDQTEYAEKMRNPETTFTVLVVDEENSSENTGQDITIIKAQEEDFSNIHADRYVHTVWCSPKEIPNPNADILLYITSKNEKRMTTHAKLYYRYWEGQIEYTQLLGYVVIPVQEIIHNWVHNVRPLFYEKLQLEARITKKRKCTKTYEETINQLGKVNKRIKEEQKKDWYVHYYMKKRKRLDLVTKYKINKPRILKYAPVIVKIIKRFERLVQYKDLIKKDIIQNNVKLEMRKAGLPQSIVGEVLTTQEVLGVIEAIKGHNSIREEIKQLDHKLSKGRISINYFNEQTKELTSIAKEMHDNIKLQLQEYQKCLDALEEYKEET